MRRPLFVVATLSSVLVSSSAAGEDTPAAAEIARLRERIEKLERAPAFGVRGLRLSGLVQVDAVLSRQSSVDEVDPSTGEPLNENRILLRRGRIRATYERDLLSGGIELDANTVRTPTVRIFGAEVSLRSTTETNPAVPWIMGTIGLIRIPFGFEVPMVDRDQIFLERSAMANALFPGFLDFGARLQGGYRFLRYAVTAMNGAPAGDKQFAFRDPNESKDLIGRVGVETEVAPRVRLVAGASGLTGRGFHRGTPSTKDSFVWRDENEDGTVQLSEMQVVPGVTAVPSENFKRFALGGDMHVNIDIPHLGELVVQTEIIWAKNLDRGFVVSDPIASSRDLRQFGWYVGFTQELGRWFQVGVRYDRYDPDSDARDRRGAALVPKDTSVGGLLVVAAVRHGAGRLTAGYNHSNNALGRAQNGAPTTLADDSFTLRAQVQW